MILEGGGALTSCACEDRRANKLNLCLADAARSRAPGGTNLCKSHGAMYQRRLESLACPNIGCPHLVMAAYTSDKARANSARPRDIPEHLPGAVCMFCHIGGWDETSRRELVDRHGTFIEGSASSYEGTPARSRDFCLLTLHTFCSSPSRSFCRPLNRPTHPDGT